MDIDDESAMKSGIRLAFPQVNAETSDTLDTRDRRDRFICAALTGLLAYSHDNSPVWVSIPALAVEAADRAIAVADMAP